MLYDDLVPHEGQWLAHFGVKGQKWGVRRYQNPDGTLTPEGKERYYSGGKITEIGAKRLQQLSNSWVDTFKNHLEYGELISAGLSKKQISNIRNAKVKEIEEKQKQIYKAIQKDPNLQTKKKILNAIDKYMGGIDDEEFIELAGVKGLINEFAYSLSKYPEAAPSEYFKTNPKAQKLRDEYENLLKERESIIRETVDNLLGEYSTLPAIKSRNNLGEYTVERIIHNNLLG